VFSFYSGNLGISIIEIWVLADLSAADQFNAVCFRGFDEVWSPNGFQSGKSPGMGWFNPKNGLFNGESYGYLSYLTLAIPMLFVGPILPHRQTALFGMEIIWYHQASTLCYMGWIPIEFGEFQVLMAENQKVDSVDSPSFSLVVSIRIHYVPIWRF
jgi:hypothetical protein